MNASIRTLLVVCSAAFASQAFSATSICKQINATNPFLGQQCVDATRGQLFDQEALALCSSIVNINSFLAVTCVKSIGNKSYSSEEIRACAMQNSNVALMAQCLSNSGQNVCR